jgi:hypothetical protein
VYKKIDILRPNSEAVSNLGWFQNSLLGKAVKCPLFPTKSKIAAFFILHQYKNFFKAGAAGAAYPQGQIFSRPALAVR